MLRSRVRVSCPICLPIMLRLMFTRLGWEVLLVTCMLSVVEFRLKSMTLVAVVRAPSGM